MSWGWRFVFFFFLHFLNVEMFAVELTFGPAALVSFNIVVPCINGLSYFVLVSLLVINRIQPPSRKTYHANARHPIY